MTWEIEGENFNEGDIVSCRCEWRDGSIREHTGSLITIVGDECFIEVPGLGPIAGMLDTLEHE